MKLSMDATAYLLSKQIEHSCPMICAFFHGYNMDEWTDLIKGGKNFKENTVSAISALLSKDIEHYFGGILRAVTSNEWEACVSNSLKQEIPEGTLLKGERGMLAFTEDGACFFAKLIIVEVKKLIPNELKMDA